MAEMTSLSADGHAATGNTKFPKASGRRQSRDADEGESPIEGVTGVRVTLPGADGASERVVLQTRRISLPDTFRFQDGAPAGGSSNDGAPTRGNSTNGLGADSTVNIIPAERVNHNRMSPQSVKKRSVDIPLNEIPGIVQGLQGSKSDRNSDTSRRINHNRLVTSRASRKMATSNQRTSLNPRDPSTSLASSRGSGASMTGKSSPPTGSGTHFVLYTSNHITPLSSPNLARGPVIKPKPRGSKTCPPTLTLSARAKVERERTFYTEKIKKPQKVLRLDDALNARPPLQIDMEGPTPVTYTPRDKPLYETNAPQYSFGKRSFVEKDSMGSRTSWAKTWFQSPNAFTNKTNFYSESKWPSPASYQSATSLGPRQRTLQEYPAYTIGTRKEFTMVKLGSKDEPSPNDYRKDQADDQMFRRAPSFSHGNRQGGTQLWPKSEKTPGPGSYDLGVIDKPRRPAFTITGHRSKTHFILGPYAA